MCGIAGVLSFEGGATEDTALAMSRRLRHRGPDGLSAYVSPDGRCALGHARLAVIDLHTGDQPMGNEDGRVQVVFNGEIYNFQTLREELAGLGHEFRTQSDTEVIVHGWEQWGPAVTERLDGMFALAIWDERRHRLFLARDRAGKKPLFVYRDSGRLAFASEMKSFLELDGFDDRLDSRALPLYLAYGYVPTPGTFYRAVTKLQPGSWLEVTPEGLEREERYWRLDFTPRARSDAESVDGFRERMRHAVKSRLVADVPLGAFLSGGLDSTVVVGLMSEFASGPVRTFSIGFAGDPTYDETRYARMAAERFGTEHTEFVVEPQSIELVDRLVEAYDEPFGDSSGIPTFVVSRMAREHVTVALTGDGGDEVLGGYWRFYGAMVAEAMPRWMAGIGDAIGRRLPYDPNFRSPSRRFSRFFRASASPAAERTLRWIGFFPDLDAILEPEYANLLGRSELLRSFQEPLDRNAALSSQARTLALNFETYLLDDLLVKSDRCSMANSLELRSPFLDTAVMEFCASLPDHVRIRNRSLKWLLRAAFRKLMPPEIVTRGKMGFGVPLPTWFRGEWMEELKERVLADDARISTWIRPDAVRTLVDDHVSARVDNGHALWALLTLETWLRSARYSLE